MLDFTCKKNRPIEQPTAAFEDKQWISHIKESLFCNILFFQLLSSPTGIIFDEEAVTVVGLLCVMLFHFDVMMWWTKR